MPDDFQQSAVGCELGDCVVSVVGAVQVAVGVESASVGAVEVSLQGGGSC